MKRSAPIRLQSMLAARRGIGARAAVLAWLVVAAGAALPGTAAAHDPLFSPSPHPLFKGGIETRLSEDLNDTTAGTQRALTLNVFYGATAHWTVGARLPYVNNPGFSGAGDLALETRYELWGDQGLGYDDGLSAFAVISPPTGDRRARNWITGGDTWDGMLGLGYSHEAITWYWWLEGWGKVHGEDDSGLRPGSSAHFSAILGRRFNAPDYRSLDVVGMVELNGEYAWRDRRNGTDRADSGGTRLFASPGLFVTYRNFGAKVGVQLPLVQNLNGSQATSNYRLRVQLIAHF